TRRARRHYLVVPAPVRTVHERLSDAGSSAGWLVQLLDRAIPCAIPPDRTVAELLLTTHPLVILAGVWLALAAAERVRARWWPIVVRPRPVIVVSSVMTIG